MLRHENFVVCGVAANGKEAIAKVAELRPDVVVLDFVMPEMNGLEAAPHIRKIAPSTKIILISGYLPPRIGSEAAQMMGAEAYVEKCNAIIDLAPTIRSLM